MLPTLFDHIVHSCIYVALIQELIIAVCVLICFVLAIVASVYIFELI